MKKLFCLAALCAAAHAQVRVVVSSSAGERFVEKQLTFTREVPAGLPEISVDATRGYQTIEGFGATFNEAGLMVLNRIPRDRADRVLNALFEPIEGAGFSLMKSPIAACDFASAGPWYTFDDTPGDVALKKFSIKRDLGSNGQITFIKRAQKFGAFKIHGTTDYPPDWMLDDKMSLKREYFPVMAKYFALYLKEYEKQGVKIDYLSPFNEPQYIYCRITYDEIREFIKNHLGPELARAGLKTKLQVSDAHNRETGLNEFPKVLNDPEARRYISTMPVHGYLWEKQTSAPLTKLHDLFPGIAIWQSEVCYAKTIDKKPMPVYGFEDGDRWGRMIIDDMKNWVSGWIYWNMVLDQTGGPWLVSEKHNDPEDNPQHPVVIVDTEKKQPYYTGLYYYLAHFSKFVRPGSVRVEASGALSDASFVAFSDARKRILEVINSGTERRFVVRDGDRTAVVTQPAKSIATYMWEEERR